MKAELTRYLVGIIETAIDSQMLVEVYEEIEELERLSEIAEKTVELVRSVL